MAFHDVRLPEDVERGVQGGLSFATDVLPLDSGEEQRNSRWAQAKGRWDVSYGLMSLTDQGLGTYLNGVRDFFYARRGMANTFRFKDWADYTIAGPQAIGLGDDSTVAFQIYKRYSSGGENYDREVFRIVAGSYTLYLDGSPLTETTHYTLNAATGVVTMVTPPASTGGSGPSSEEVLQIACEFDNNVRFDTDSWNLTLEQVDAGSLPELPIVTVRLASS